MYNFVRLRIMRACPENRETLRPWDLCQWLAETVDLNSPDIMDVGFEAAQGVGVLCIELHFGFRT